MTTWTILGCGTSTGVPLIGCDCKVCLSRNPKDKRLRASVWVKVGRKSFLIDTSPDLRQQALKEKIRQVDAVLYTHPHADHIHGIDELRSYNYLQRSVIPAYGNAWTVTELQEKFPYIFRPAKVVEGGGIPRIELRRVVSSAPWFEASGVRITPIGVEHGSRECLGYRIGSVAYVTDCSYIPELSLERLKGLSVLFLDCLRLARHGTHFNLDQALETVSKLRPRRTFFTHLGHDFEYLKWKKKLPKGVALAFDGLRINS